MWILPRTALNRRTKGNRRGPKRKISTMQMKATFVAVTLLLTVSAAMAYPNEPDGFRGFAWGSSLKSARFIDCSQTIDPDRKLCFAPPPLTVRLNDIEIEVFQLSYGFWRTQLDSVSFRAEASPLIEEFLKRFGPPASETRLSDQVREMEWKGERTNIRATCEELTKTYCSVTIDSVKMLQKEWNETRKAARKNRRNDL